MAVSVLERITLGKELSSLMQEQKTAPVLQRISIGKQIVEVMLKLGLGVTASDSPDPVPDPLPTEDFPDVVKAFLAGDFVNLPQMEFIDKLRDISGYVGQYLTLDQAKEQTINWVTQNGYAA
jgi:hypothetical protein